jgi:crotonobetainyl-CoA:carnitine CoA-transferase CaiB-like acyl-CoA transferase
MQEPARSPAPRGPLAGLRVIDLSTVLAGPLCAQVLGDYGADVIKVEHPQRGDSFRTHGPARDDHGLWWKIVSRNKRCIGLYLGDPDGAEVFRRLAAEADVVIENFRPGTLERWGVGWDVLHELNPRLVLVRITGFGQEGPYRSRPGFGTLAEAMSGFAAINGEPDGPPLLPPIALTDEVTALVAAFATMVAVHSGVGQVVDVNLLESMLQLMGPLVSAHGLLGYEQPRLGSGIPYTVPRGTYRCADGRWVAISTSADSVARRVMELVGLGGDARFATFAGRVEHRDEVDAHVADWVGARPLDEVLAAFEAAHAAAAPVYAMADIAADPHLAAREAVIEVDDVPMQGLIARLSRTPGGVRWAGRPLGADTDAVRREVDALDGADPGR